MKRLLAAAVLAATFVAPSTQAAEMNVAVIKGIPTIYVGGDIVTGDADKFMRFTARFPAGKSAVVLNSPGGNLSAKGSTSGSWSGRSEWSPLCSTSAPRCAA